MGRKQTELSYFKEIHLYTKLIKMMIGKPLKYFPKQEKAPGILEIATILIIMILSQEIVLLHINQQFHILVGVRCM